MLTNEHNEVFNNFKNKSVLIYAPGGGFGHFTRALAIAHTFNLSNVTLVVSSMPVTVGSQNIVSVERIPQSAQDDKSVFRQWFTEMLQMCQPEMLMIDTFPAGIKGELNEVDLNGIQTVLIGRNLKWDVYKRNVPYIRNKINQIYLIESVNDQYLHFLKMQYCLITKIEIDYFIESYAHDPVFVKTIKKCTGPKWLLVHSGSREECDKLQEYAYSIAHMHRIIPILFLCGDFSTTSQNFLQLIVDKYPVCQYYSLFDRVITGAGYNSVHQAKRFANAYNFYPFERLYDDQYARIRRSVNEFLHADGNEVNHAFN